MRLWALANKGQLKWSLGCSRHSNLCASFFSLSLPWVSWPGHSRCWRRGSAWSRTGTTMLKRGVGVVKKLPWLNRLRLSITDLYTINVIHQIVRHHTLQLGLKIQDALCHTVTLLELVSWTGLNTIIKSIRQLKLDWNWKLVSRASVKWQLCVSILSWFF